MRAPLPVSTTCPWACSRSRSTIQTGSSIKYDGFPSAHIENGSENLVSRKFNIHKSFPQLCKHISNAIHVGSVILDGEIVHLDGQGKPQFYSLLRRRSPQAVCRLWHSVAEGQGSQKHAADRT